MYPNVAQCSPIPGNKMILYFSVQLVAKLGGGQPEKWESLSLTTPPPPCPLYRRLCICDTYEVCSIGLQSMCGVSGLQTIEWRTFHLAGHQIWWSYLFFFTVVTDYCSIFYKSCKDIHNLTSSAWK